MFSLRVALLVSLFALTACPGPCPQTLTLGTGGSSFEPLSDGEGLTIQSGGQGAHHVWGAVRVTGAPVSGPLSFSLTNDAQQLLASRSIELGLFTATRATACGWDLAGQTVVFSSDPTMLPGTKATLSVSLGADLPLAARADVVLR